jgi:hypothetical protein
MRGPILAILLLPVVAFAGDSPFDGTWKVDPSTYDSISDKPTVIVLQNGTYQIPSSVPKINIKADGTDQPVPGARDYDTLAVKVVNDRTVETISKKNGRVVESLKATVSPDGKTTTVEDTYYPIAGKQVSSTVTHIRVAAGPSGSHAVSGSWRIQKAEAPASAHPSFTLKSTPDGLMYSEIGVSYDAKFDGKEYPFKGVSGGVISLTKLNNRSFVETFRRDGKVVEVNHMTVSADGKTMSIRIENKEKGFTTTYTAIKQ